MTLWIRITTALLVALTCGCVVKKPVSPVVKSVTVKNHALYIERCTIVRGDHDLELADCRVEQVRIDATCPATASPEIPAAPNGQ